MLDAVKGHGFTFRRLAPGPDGPLWGIRDTDRWRDTIYIGGFSDGCSATRSRKSPLLAPGGLLVTDRVSGNALNVLNTAGAGTLGVINLGSFADSFAGLSYCRTYVR